MKFPDYHPHLGFFRHFALCRGLYDRIKALEDQLRAKDASQAVKVKSMESTIAGLMETIARKNNYQPIQPDLRPQPTQQQVKQAPRSGSEWVASRQSQDDMAAKLAAREVEAARVEEFNRETREIIGAGVGK